MDLILFHINNFAYLAIGGLIYGYMALGTPFLPRKLLPKFLPLAGTPGIIAGLVTNTISTPELLLVRALTYMTFIVGATIGACLRLLVEVPPVKEPDD